jgi:hypothetical protein
MAIVKMAENWSHTSQLPLYKYADVFKLTVICYYNRELLQTNVQLATTMLSDVLLHMGGNTLTNDNYNIDAPMFIHPHLTGDGIVPQDENVNIDEDEGN